VGAHDPVGVAIAMRDFLIAAVGTRPSSPFSGDWY
jgi:hypothetical protein